MFRPALCGFIALGSVASIAAADVVYVDAQSVIFDAGREVSTLDGMLPVGIDIPAGADYMYVSEVSGLVRAHPVLQWGGPDGNMTTLNDTDIDSYNRISGLVHPGTMPLVGVFLTDSLPDESAPARLDFYSVGTEFAELSPLVAQSFHVGDGWNSAEAMHKFWIPEGATRLYLGFADAGFFTGDPSRNGGAYHDNSGGFNADVQFHVVPTPGAIALLGMGGLVGIRRRR